MRSSLLLVVNLILISQLIQAQVPIINLEYPNKTVGDAQLQNISNYLQTNKGASSLKIVLDNQIFTQSGFQNFTFTIQQMTGLRNLNLQLSMNQLNDQSSLFISEMLSGLTSLEYLILNLNFNSLGEDSVYQILNGTLNSKNLKSIQIEMQSNVAKQYENTIQIHRRYLNATSQTAMRNLHLNFENCQYQGNFVKDYLSPFIGLYVNLLDLTLNLNGNPSIHQTSQYLYQLISPLTSMTSINLKLADLDIETDCTYISQLLEGLNQLNGVELDLQLNNLTATCISSIGNSLGSKKKMSQLILNLAQNQVTDSSFTQLMSNISSLTGLIYLNLNLYQNQLTQLSAKSIGSALQSLKIVNIVNFNLSTNSIKDEGLNNITVNLGKPSYLYSITLDVSSNNVTDKSINSLLSTVSSSEEIYYFFLSARNSQISLSQAINSTQNTVLYFYTLDFQSDNLTSSGVQNLGTHLTYFPIAKNLTLNLQSNQFNSTGAASLVKDVTTKLGNLIYLQLNLQANQITTQECSTIIQQANSTQTCTLNQCQIAC